MTREAHEALKDLQKAKKEIPALLRAGIEGMMVKEVTAQLEALNKKTKQAIEEAQAGVEKRFNTIAALLLAEDKTSVREGEPTLEQLVKAKANGKLKRKNETDGTD